MPAHQLARKKPRGRPPLYRTPEEKRASKLDLSRRLRERKKLGTLSGDSPPAPPGPSGSQRRHPTKPPPTTFHYQPTRSEKTEYQFTAEPAVAQPQPQPQPQPSPAIPGQPSALIQFRQLGPSAYQSLLQSARCPSPESPPRLESPPCPESPPRPQSPPRLSSPPRPQAMAAIRADVQTIRVTVQVVTLLKDKEPPPGSDQGIIHIKQYHSGFAAIVGQGASYAVLLETASTTRNPFFHNACVYLHESDELWTTSDLLQPSSSSQLPAILISKVGLQRDTLGGDDNVAAVEWRKLRPPPEMPMPAGACVHANSVMYCSQGTMVPDTGGVFFMPKARPPKPLVTSFGYRPFNSPQHVTTSRDGSLWFTDPPLGADSGIRPQPQLPAHVYRYNLESASLRVLVDGLQRPMGLCFDSAEQTLYVTDIGIASAGGGMDTNRPSTIYAFDVMQRGGQPFVANKRVFAFPTRGAPMAVKCDDAGNVYAACSDGIEIFNPGGELLGLIEVSGGCSNFSFGKQGEIFICAKQRLFRVKFDGEVSDTTFDLM